MKTYHVKTQDLVNEHYLHSAAAERRFVDDYQTTDLAEAEAVFNKEVAQLSRECKSLSEIDERYDPFEKDPTRVVYCSIVAIDVNVKDKFDPPQIGVPTFFSFFNQKIFYFKKLFLYL